MTISIGIIGHGHFGQHLVRDLIPRFARTATVKIFSPGEAGEKFAPLQEVATCGVVVLAVPIRVYEEVLLAVLPHVRRETVIVDVASVKGYTSGLFRKYVGNACGYICMHPMFGPQSFLKRGGHVAGFKIVVTEQTLPPDIYRVVKRVLVGFEFDVVEMTAAQHDRHLAETLFLTHFVGQIVHRAEFDNTAMDTVSFELLMDAVKSVAGDGGIFEDVYRYAREPCDEVLRVFNAAQELVRARLASVHPP